MQNTIPARCFYRATFRNPIVRKHQLCVKVLCDVEVEIYPETRQRWRARILATGARLDVSGPSPDNVKSQVRDLYEEQVSDWAIYDEQIGKPMAEPQPHRPPPAHIMATNAKPLPEQKQVRAVCGKVVHRRQIVADQNLDQWLEARRDAAFVGGAEQLITCSQCRIIIKQAEEKYASQTKTQ